MPTPAGEPVRITAPAGRVELPERKAIRSATLNCIDDVWASCRTAPLSRKRSRRDWGSRSSSVVTRQGPSGQNVSKDLPLVHWPPLHSFCQSRAETSLAQQ